LTVIPFRHREFEEVVGPLHHVEKCSEGGIVALIGKIPTWLPSDLEPRLRELIGRRISILKLDGRFYIKAGGKGAP